ncbi:hypothetical protein CFO_g2715 [Ceratocystis platani]|uniref:C2H2-type domain-containing protein n=1 Tax=Ceratocystis fimbriata f. sp. platani TaxID=88771 RepID=A0A0F8B1B9_CERFI|nr:hypothetical protein CFO_g2715 [Ceratocystis platani]
MDPPQKRRKLAPKVPQPPSSSPSQANSHTIPAPAAAAVAAETGSVPARVEFERFARHLQDAAMMIQRSAERPNYTSVSALLVRWEDDVAAEDDIVAVEKVLREQYSFETEQWHIPSVANASLKLGVQVTEFLKNSKPDSLLIFYYAGHGFVAPDDQVYWACNTNDDSPKLKWDGIRYLFEDSQSDVLFLLDTCIASATIPPQSGNMVGFTGSRRTQNTVSKEVEDGRILLEAHEAAKRNSIVGEEIAAPETPFRKVTLAREGATVSSDDPMQEVHYQSKDDVEESAEMKEAAEQLKALSHTRHPIPDATLTPQQQNRRRSTLPDSAPERREDGLEPEIKQEETPESATRPKAQRRSIPKAAPRNDTRCTLCSHLPFKDSSSLRKHIAAAHTRPFPCAFSFAGCSSTFGSKNEWKRHIASQHLCLQYYRCSACPASAAEGKFNEFNRKDLFTQHLRRMHAPFAIKKNAGKADARLQADWEATVKEMQQSCLVQRRLPPQRSACPKADCQSIFEGSTSWDEWTEHVGRHMEKSEAQGMGIDRNLAKWALDERIIERDENGEYKLVPDVTYSGRHHEHHHQPITLPTVAASTTVADAPSTSASVATGSGAGRAIALDSPTSVAGGATGPGSGAAVAAVAAVAGSLPSDQKRKRSDWRGELVPLGSMEIDEGA